MPDVERSTTTVPALLAARAGVSPESVALALDTGEQLTYREWDRRSNALAHRLVRDGVPRGDRVGLSFTGEAWLQYAIAYVGVQKAGATPVVLGAHLGPESVRTALEHCGVTRVLGAGDVGDEAGPAAPPHGPGPGDVGQILWTSGTTGAPKAVVATHANLTHGLERDPRRRPLAHSAHCLHAFALGTNAAQSMLLQALVAAPTTLVCPDFDAERFAAVIERDRVGSVFVVPATAGELVRARIGERYDLSSVVLLGSTAAALPGAVAADLARMLPEAVITNCYTSTEAAPAELTMIVDPDRPDALGRPARPGPLRITGDDGRPVPPGVVGQVWLRSPAPPRTYLGADPEPTGGRAARPPADGWVAMGDLGLLDDDGYLRLVDRADDLVKTGALPVSTLRVEAALHEHPEVAAAAVVAVDHPRLGQVPAAAVVPAPGGEISEPELRTFLIGRLDRHEVPARIEVTTELPLTPAGKVAKRELTDRLALDRRTPGPAPGAGTPTALAQLWSQLLDPAVGVGDDFFARGGDSLAAARLASLIGERFGVEASAALAFEHPDLAGQAAWIDAARAAPEEPAPEEPGGEEPGGEEPGGDVHEMGSMQEDLLRWMHETDPPRDAKTVYASVRVEDDLDVPALVAGVEALVERHEALRSHCRRTRSGWKVVVDPGSAVDVVVEEATGEQDAADRLRAAVERPIDWREGPQVRTVVVRTGPRAHLVALVAHHLSVDGWSIGVLLHELGLLYGARRSGTPVELPPPVPAREVVARQRSRWAAERPWWRATMAGAAGAVDDFPGRRPATHYRAAHRDVDVDPARPAATELAEKHRTTSFVVVASAWLAVLARHTGTARFTLRTVLTGRTRTEFEPAVGCLAQPVLVPIALDDDPGLAALVGRYRERLRRAAAHQTFRLADFGDAVPYPVEIPFTRWEPTHLPGLDSREHELPHALVLDWALPGPDRGAPKLELALAPDDRLTARITYNAHAFDVPLIDALGQHLVHLLTHGLRAPETPLLRIPPVDARSRP